jgi:hypothetical protein
VSRRSAGTGRSCRRHERNENGEGTLRCSLLTENGIPLEEGWRSYAVVVVVASEKNESDGGGGGGKENEKRSVGDDDDTCLSTRLY